MSINKYGKQEKLQMIETAEPSITGHEVLVEIHAASINPVDFKIRDGKVKLLLQYQMPLILGNDFAGKIVQVGEQVTSFKIGDLVYGRPRKHRIGTFAEYLAVHEEDIAIQPSNLSSEEAASIPLVGLTTWQAFHEVLQLQGGQKILIHAGAGGVGTFAIQLAKEMQAMMRCMTHWVVKRLQNLFKC